MAETNHGLAVLYTFRRCPYAMRARLALLKACISVELREILLKDKPRAMIAISSKGTVPVLHLPDSQVLDESTEVMHWALEQHDPDSWLDADPLLTRSLIDENDSSFKQALDRYKYFTRYPGHPQEYYRAQGETFLARLETQLSLHDGIGLVKPGVSLADIAIFPFVRQFAGVDADWFGNSKYRLLRRWLDEQINAPHFHRIMKKYPLWLPGQNPIIENWHPVSRPVDPPPRGLPPP